MSAPFRLLLVDDHAVVRAGLAALLGAEVDLDVVGEAGTGEEAVQRAAALCPDVVLMDLQLGPGLDGVAATRAVLDVPDPPRVLVLTTYDADTDVLRAVAAGATGYLLKACPPAELLAAVRAAGRGESALSPAVASRLVQQVRTPQAVVSPRESDILRLLARGAGNKEIARQLFISEATVKTHLTRIYTKLGVQTRTAAVTAAVERRIIRLD